MTREIPSAAETFVAHLKGKHPALDVSCDVPEVPTGSTWIDIRIRADWIVVEHHPELGFGLTEPRDEDGMSYGTPSCRFVRTADEALDEVERMLQDLASPVTATQRRT